MIDKAFGYYILVCDICGDCSEESFDNFQDVVDAKNELEWKSQKTIKGWEEICPYCK